MRKDEENKMITNCQHLFDRTREDVQEGLKRVRELQYRGLEDLNKAVELVREHKLHTKRLFSRDTLSGLKRCRVNNFLLMYLLRINVIATIVGRRCP